jgi:hypothetical protein
MCVLHIKNCSDVMSNLVRERERERFVEIRISKCKETV